MIPRVGRQSSQSPWFVRTARRDFGHGTGIPPQQPPGSARMRGARCRARPGLSGLDHSANWQPMGSDFRSFFIQPVTATISMSVRAMKAGALEFLTKPFHDQDSVGREFNKLLNVVAPNASTPKRLPELRGFDRSPLFEVKVCNLLRPRKR